MADQDEPTEIRLRRSLTETGDTFTNDGVAGLALADGVPDEDRPYYKPDVLRAFADALEDVQGQVEIGIGPVKEYSGRHADDDDEAPLALYAVVPESDVVALACPWTGTPLHERMEGDE